MSTLSTAANNLYGLYVRATTDLAQSMVIKYEEIAKSLNLYVINKTGALPNLADPTSWKYYQNICGIYHFSDTAMTVSSLDSETNIPFTVQALQNNPVTRAAYAFGSTYYNDLLANYPDQELLILGILYPANMSAAIAAPDGTILSYPTHLIEPGEVDLLANLQAWIYAYTKRWIIRAFCLTDNLYAATFMAQLMLNLIGAITNFRLQACKTNQAHSFHIKQYLRSHGFLDVYLDQMSNKQALDMYRNIIFYERNAGFESTFARLVDVVLTEANLPAYHYEMLHNQDSLSHEFLEDVNHLHSQANFRRRPLNAKARQYPLPDYTLTQVHAAASTQTPHNSLYQDVHYEEIANRLSLSSKAHLLTKVVEVGANPVVSPSQLAPDDILFNQWMDWVSSSRYAVPVEFVPEGSKSPVRLTHQQAAALWIFAFHRALEPEKIPNYPKLTRVPAIYINRVVRTPKPQLSVLQEVVSNAPLHPSVVQAIYDTAVTIPSSITSLVQFQQVCGQIYLADLLQYRLYSYQENPIARSQAQGASLRLYEDKTVRFASLADEEDEDLGMLYSTMLQQVGLNTAGYRPIDYFNMSVRILAAATGADLNDLLDPANIQKAMISLLRYLSSYSIQIVSTGASALSTTVPRPDVRFYDYRMPEQPEYYVDAKFTHVLKVPTTVSFTQELPLAQIPISGLQNQQSSFSETMPMAVVSEDAYKVVPFARSNFDLGLSITSDQDPDEQFQALTMEQKMQTRDVYGYNG